MGGNSMDTNSLEKLWCWGGNLISLKSHNWSYMYGSEKNKTRFFFLYSGTKVL